MSSLARAYARTERLWWDISPRGILILIGVLTVVRFLVAANAGMLWDEPYYWTWAQHLSAGYFDHPPMVAYWIWAGTQLFGDGVLGIRLPFLLNTLATTAAAWGIGRVLFTPRIAWLGALWTNVTPLLGIAGFMATPDGPSVLFWTLTVLAYALVIRTERGHWWLLVGLLAGLGLMSKYTNLFLGAGIVLSLALDPRLRRWFASPWLYAGGALALLVFLPVVFWNAQHDWMSFRFQFGRVGEWHLTPVYLVTLLIVQPLIFNPLVSILLANARPLWQGLGWFRSYAGNLIATTLPAIAFIIFQSTHGEVLQHWLAPVFPTLTVVAVAAASALRSDQWFLRRVRTDVVPFALIISAIAFLYAALPLERYAPFNDPLASIRGWPAYAADVEALRQSSGAEWIATSGYENSGALAYELRNAAIVVPVVERQRTTFAPPPDPSLLTQPALLIFRSVEPNEDALRRCFARLTPLGTVSRNNGAGPVQTNAVFLAEGANPEIFSRGCDALP